MALEAKIPVEPGAGHAAYGAAVLRGLMETPLIGFAIGDSTGVIVDANEAFASLLGYTRSELLQKQLNWHRLTPPEYAGRDRAALEELKSAGISRGYAKEYIRRDGSRIAVQLAAISITGTADEHAVFILDDSRRRTAEAEMRRTEEMHRQILDATPDLVLLRGPDSRIVWANRAFLDFHGVTQESLAGRRAPPHWGTDVVARELRDDAIVLDTGVTIDLPHVTLHRRDGAVRIFHLVRSPVTDGSGLAARTVSVFRDVTDRARSEQALQRSDANLRTAQALAQMGSWELHSPDRGDDYWSDETFRIVGLEPTASPPSLVEYMQHIVHPDDLARGMAALNETFEHGTPLDIEYRIVRADGALRWVRTQGALAPDAREGGKKLFGTIRDVTDRREADAARERLEARLRQAQKLEAIGTLAGGIAHDFNNILGALCGYAELAMEATHGNDHAQADLQQVLQAAARATDLVSRILTFSRRRERSRTRLRPERTITEALQLLRASLPATIEIREHFDPQTPDVMADETQLLQVVLNLGTNALHAMAARGGALSLELAPFRVDAAFARAHPGLRPGWHALLTVSDTGGGIEPHLLERVLEPFFTTKPPGQGTGLGLSVVHGIVNEHDGGLVVESTPGAGTTVRVYLPAMLHHDVVATTGPGAAPRGSGQRVLVVDDESALAELCRRRLDQLGYAPTAFTDSLLALEAFRKHPDDFDVVLADHTMPHLTGIELAREMRRLRPTLPVVLVSGHGAAVNPETLRAAGICRLLAKPVPSRTLAEAIRNALEESPV